jgi:large subunit ribosomal protein L13
MKTYSSKTYSAKPDDVVRKWYVVDAKDDTLGRISTQIAKLLMGKDKPMFTHHIDTGDYVIVLNAKDLVVTGKKLDQKMYYRHSGYPGGLKEWTLKEQMESDPTEVIRLAVRNMLPVNKLRPERLKRLKIYLDENHEHDAQKPEKLSLKDNK